ncbi:hypothetical protein chiPu_0031106, partial [Chiloscyllium punctatum]|nr:hypothetical protein [Chiloscyllium punctatum]
MRWRGAAPRSRRIGHIRSESGVAQPRYRERSRRRTAATFSRLPNAKRRQSMNGRRPNLGPSSNTRRRQWDKTSEVPEVHGAS